MKTNRSLQLLAPLCVALLSLFASTQAQAQANPYPFTNNLPAGCVVTLNYSIDQFVPPCTNCQPSTPIVVNPGSTVFLSWGTCVVPICDIYVQVTQIATTLLTPPLMGSVNTAPPSPIPVAGCGSTVRLILNTSAGGIRP